MSSLAAFATRIKESGAAQRSLARAAGRFMSSAPRAAAVGGAVGATHGALTHGPDDTALSGAIRGGVIGAGAGALAGSAGSVIRNTRLLNPGMSTGQAAARTVANTGGEIKRFGQRQLHGLTGAYSKTPGAIGLRGSEEAAKRIHVADLRHGADTAGLQGPALVKAQASHAEEVKGLKEWGAQGDAAHKAGITNLPGLARGLRTPLRTGKALVQDLGAGPGAVAWGVGVPMAIAAPGLARGDESASGGQSVRQKVLGATTGVLGGIATGGLPIIPQMMAGTAIDAATGRLLNHRSAR